MDVCPTMKDEVTLFTFYYYTCPPTLHYSSYFVMGQNGLRATEFCKIKKWTSNFLKENMYNCRLEAKRHIDCWRPLDHIVIVDASSITRFPAVLNRMFRHTMLLPEVVTASCQDHPMGRKPFFFHKKGNIAVLLAGNQRAELLWQQVDVVYLRHRGQWSQRVAVTHVNRF